MSPEEAFSEISKQVKLIDNLIMSDVREGFACPSTESKLKFNRHLLITKCWFSRVSNANKKRFVVSLLKDVRNAMTISLLLKSIWNCRPKDAVLSISGKETWSRYDQAAMDHNRTALPFDMLLKMVQHDRDWFRTLEPERQSLVLLELLSVAGGPVMWAVLRRAETIYDNYREEQLINIQKSVVAAALSKTAIKVKSKKSLAPDRTDVDVASVTSARSKSAYIPQTADKELQLRLEEWNGIIKCMKASFNLEETVFFKDGIKNTIWKVNRTRPEATETVDFLQLLPAGVAKQILSYIPQLQLSTCAQVNKYWAYLVEDLARETNARRQLDIDTMQMECYILHQITTIPDSIRRADPKLETHERFNTSTMEKRPQTEIESTSSTFRESVRSNFRPKTKNPRSCLSNSYSIMINDARKQRKRTETSLPPIRNMKDMSVKLNRRGAVDNSLWQWRETALKKNRLQHHTLSALKRSSISAFESMHFPGPLTASWPFSPHAPLPEYLVLLSVPKMP